MQRGRVPSGALAAGSMLFTWRDTVPDTWARLPRAATPTGWYVGALALLSRCAALQTRALQSGLLRHYLLLTIVVTVALVGGTLVLRHDGVAAPPRESTWVGVDTPAVAADAGVRDTACCTVIRLCRYERIVTGKTENPRTDPESIPEHPKVRWTRKYRRALKISTVVLVAHLIGLATSMHALMASRTAPGATAWIVALNATPYLAVPAYWVPAKSASEPKMRMTPTATMISRTSQRFELRSGSGW